MPHNYSPVTPEIITRLAEIVGPENVSSKLADLDLRSNDQGPYTPHRAEVIAWVSDTQQVSRLLGLANEQHIPVTAWGAGTSLEGILIPLQGGIQISFERMNRILAVHDADFQVTVQPGLGYKDLNAALTRYGLFFAPDPGANASIGGMLANNAAGIRTVKYGATRDNVLRMEVVLADGRVLHVGSRSIKQSSGYDLTHLFIGSEGTLGLITEATLRLAPIPVYFSAAVASFENVRTAIEAVVAVRGSGLEPAALEFIDPITVELISANDGLGLPSKPAVLMEFQAAQREGLESTLEAVREMCEECGSVRFFSTTNQSERLKLWNARHHTLETIIRTYPGKKVKNSDVAVPISAYPELIDFIQARRLESGLIAYAFGHAGDGNIHVDYVYSSPAEEQASNEMNAAVVHKAISLGGTETPAAAALVSSSAISESSLVSTRPVSTSFCCSTFISSSFLSTTARSSSAFLSA